MHLLTKHVNFVRVELFVAASDLGTVYRIVLQKLLGDKHALLLRDLLLSLLVEVFLRLWFMIVLQLSLVEDPFVF